MTHPMLAARQSPEVARSPQDSIIELAKGHIGKRVIDEFRQKFAGEWGRAPELLRTLSDGSEAMYDTPLYTGHTSQGDLVLVRSTSDITPTDQEGYFIVTGNIQYGQIPQERRVMAVHHHHLGPRQDELVTELVLEPGPWAGFPEERWPRLVLSAQSCDLWRGGILGEWSALHPFDGLERSLSLPARDQLGVQAVERTVTTARIPDPRTAEVGVRTVLEVAA